MLELFYFVTFVLFWYFIIRYFWKRLRKSKKNDKLLFGESNPNAEPYCIVVDTETTGLAKDRNLRATKANLDNFPRIVEIAWATYSNKGEIIKEGNYIIKQKSEIPAAAIAIHGITDKQANEEGVSLSDALKKLSLDVKECTRLVGHNIMFDKRVIEAECIREGLNKPFLRMKVYDTIKIAQQHFKTKKYFKLAELYEAIYNQKVPEDVGSHRAAADVVVTAGVFFPLRVYGDTFFNRK